MNQIRTMKKALEAFGKKIIIVSNDKKSLGVGIFNKIPQFSENLNFETICSFNKEKYSLWLHNYEPISHIYKILDGKLSFSVISGAFDETIGCWRLVVQKLET